MATMIQAYQAYSPRVKIERMVEMDDVESYIEDRTGLNDSEINAVLRELHAALLFYARQGCSIRLDSVAAFSPTIDKDGTFSINVRPDKKLVLRFNDKGKFNGRLRNKDMIGKTEDEYIERWNREHPKDKIKKK
jgi:hypothetical protein